MTLLLDSEDLLQLYVFLDMYESFDMFLEGKKETLDYLRFKLLNLDVALIHNRVSICDKAILIKL